MKMYPPALINKQVTEDMLHWIMMQPNTVTINTTTNEFNVTPAKGARDYHVDDRTKKFILFELQKILEFNGFRSELLANGSLRISKDYWQMDVETIHDQLPFPDYLPHQIEQAYKHQHENNLHSSQKTKFSNNNGWTSISMDLSPPQYNHYEYPSRERLESIRQIIIDNTEGGL